MKRVRNEDLESLPVKASSQVHSRQKTVVNFYPFSLGKSSLFSVALTLTLRSEIETRKLTIQSRI